MEEKETKKPTYSVTFNTDAEGKTKFRFKPAIEAPNFKYHYKNLMDNFVSAYAELFSGVNIMRPATTEEKEKHIYVFKTDNKDDTEHQMYKARKMLYEDTLKAFNFILAHVFPDIQYIEHCQQYQQEFAFAEDKTQDEIEDYKYDVEYITQQIRENYDNLINMINESIAKEMKEANKKSDKQKEGK
jgi:hypothetical protein